MSIYNTAANDGDTTFGQDAIAFTRQKSLERLTPQTFCIFDLNMPTTGTATTHIVTPTTLQANIIVNGLFTMQLPEHGR